MKKFLIALFALAYLGAQAQTADEIIQKYSTFMGGLDAFNKITSAKFTGNASVQGMDLPVIMQVLNGKGMRTDVEAMGQQVVNAYGNGKGWKINPFNGAETATEVTGAELASFKNQASLANNLMDYKARGHKVEYAGEATVEGVKTYKLVLTSKDDNKPTTYYIVQSDYSLLKTVTSREMMGQEMEVETLYSDLKTFGNVKFAMHATQSAGGNVFQEISWSKIELNVPIDEKIFSM